MSKKYSQKWTIASYFEDLPTGYTFRMGEDPLHVTLAGVFATKFSKEDLMHLLENFHNIEAILIEAGVEADFGLQGEVRVVLIKNNDELNKLHQAIYNLLIKKGAIFDNPEFQNTGYSAHSTIQKTGHLTEKQQISINNLSLLDMFPDGDGEKRRIAGTVYFNS